MKHVFISHAGADSEMADRLCADLRNAGQEVVVDLEELQLGADTIDFMNNALSDAATVIILHSRHTPTATWQRRELNAALWNEEVQAGGRVIVLRLDDTALPPLLGPKLFAELTAGEYRRTLERLCGELLPAQTATAQLNEALRAESPNPFWRVRAEYFADEWPRLLADAFSPPDVSKMRLLQEMLPCLLSGSRGTGKTMLLLSLRARILASRAQAPKSVKDLFGFYLRLDRGAFCNAGLRGGPSGTANAIPEGLLDQITETFSQEFFIGLIESLISELLFCRSESIVTLGRAEESDVAQAIATVLTGEPSINSLDALLTSCAELHRAISEFVRRRFIYREEARAPLARLDITAFKHVIAAVRKSIPELRGAQFTAPLDEYENLLPFQKIVVNTLVKLGPPHLSVKVARKAGTEHSSTTAVGQDLQETHDYNEISLVYRVHDEHELTAYLDLLGSITGRLLESANTGFSSLGELLPAADEPEADEADIKRELRLLSRLTDTEFQRKSPSDLSQLQTYYGEAAIFRALARKRGVRPVKRYSGAKNLAFVSSGVIRYFQEILAMAFHLQQPSRTAPVISPMHQSSAVHIVSSHNFAALGRNVERHGEALRYFLVDLGDCIRHKLLVHTSEPEAGRLAIRDSDSLGLQQYARLAEIMRVGVREGVLQESLGRGGMRPRRTVEPQPTEFNIARIFCPVLQISTRNRWRTSVTCGELSALLDPSTRRAGKKRLIDKLAQTKSSTRQSALPLGGQP